MHAADHNSLVSLVFLGDLGVLWDAQIANLAIVRGYGDLESEFVDEGACISHSVPPVVWVKCHWKRVREVTANYLKLMDDLHFQSCRLVGQKVAKPDSHCLFLLL